MEAYSILQLICVLTAEREVEKKINADTRLVTRSLENPLYITAYVFKAESHNTRSKFVWTEGRIYLYIHIIKRNITPEVLIAKTVQI
jgi:hypothetical protein